jgi:hypothetical protein
MLVFEKPRNLQVLPDGALAGLAMSALRTRRQRFAWPSDLAPALRTGFWAVLRVSDGAYRSRRKSTLTWS